LDHPFVSTLLRSGPVGQTILAGLLVLSIYTWAIIFTKATMLRRAERSCRAFLERFAEAGPDWLRTSRGAPVAGPLGQLYEGGLEEYRMQRDHAPRGMPLSTEARDRVADAIEVESADVVVELERGHLVLAIAASASPFIGLFGTVWGIMNAFRGMSAEGSAGIAAVAPGVAEALVTTVAGLAVAIPAVVAYNLLNGRVKRIGTLLDRFVHDFLRAVDRSDRAGDAPTPVPSGGAEGSPVFARRES
jgi:biopolymer transport protein TolQ